MEITDVRVEVLEGTMTGRDPDGFYEDRLAWPLDVYDEFREVSAEDAYLRGANEFGHHPYEEDGDLKVKQPFLFIDTDEGITGMSGPIGRHWVFQTLEFRDLLVGRDPRATQKLWDLMYRKEVHGRKGKTMMAISGIDVALWDLKGKYYDEPVYRLLGGPTRKELPAYASMLGFSAEPDDVRQRAAEFREKGFDHQKWFLRYGPGSGREGKEQNVAMVRAAREGAGEDCALMFDAWMSWDRSYALDIIPDLAPYEPRWVEEPVMPDKIDVQREIRDAAPFPIAGGEHEYTRWGLNEILSRNALDVVQPDTYWAGGITELMNICSLGTVHDVPVIPHGHSVPANVNLIAAQSPTTCPLVEYLYKWNEGLQFFFDEPVRPEDGTVTVPDRPGMGVAIDDSKVDARSAVAFDF